MYPAQKWWRRKSVLTFVHSRNLLAVTRHSQLKRSSVLEDWFPVYVGWGTLLLLFALTFAGLKGEDVMFAKWENASDATKSSPGTFIFCLLVMYIFFTVCTLVADLGASEKTEIETDGVESRHSALPQEMKVIDEDEKYKKKPKKENRLKEYLKYALRFSLLFFLVFVLATVALFLGHNKELVKLTLEYPLWCMLFGAITSNVFLLLFPRKTNFFKPVEKYVYIKVGLVLLVFNFSAGFPSVALRALPTAWLVPSILLPASVYFCLSVLRKHIISPVLALCTGICICGVSASMAAGAAVCTTDTELAVVTTMIMFFTLIWTPVAPWFSALVGMPAKQRGAWVGSVIHNTACVQVAADAMGGEAGVIAVDVKLMKNMILPFVVMGVTFFWLHLLRQAEPEMSVRILWERFPKFVCGYVVTNVLMVVFKALWEQEHAIVFKLAKAASTWFFAFMFVVIGFQVRRGRWPRSLGRGGWFVLLYLCTQGANLVLSYVASGAGFGFS